MKRGPLLRTIRFTTSIVVMLLLAFGCASHVPVAGETDYDVIVIGGDGRVVSRRSSGNQ